VIEAEVDHAFGVGVWLDDDGQSVCPAAAECSKPGSGDDAQHHRVDEGHILEIQCRR
jgi:hypothetical protein